MTVIAFAFRLHDRHDAQPIDAEPLKPAAWKIGIHRLPGDALGVAPWVVSDLVSGRLIALDRTRPLAIAAAISRLHRAARAHGLTVPALLDAARARLAAPCGSDEEESE